jgi:hypothetical protein
MGPLGWALLSRLPLTRGVKQLGAPAAPSDQQLGRYLEYLAKNILAAYEEVQQPDLWDVKPGSSLAGDDRAANPYQISHATRSALGSSVDHMHAVINLLGEAKALHPMAPFTMLRSALESSATALWMLFPDARPERLTRRLRLAVVDARDRHQARAGAGLAGGPTLDEQIREIQGICRRGNGNVQIVAARDPSVTTILDHADQVLGSHWHYLTAWRICSGIAHARPWAHLSFLVREEVAREMDPNVATLRITSDFSRLTWALGTTYELTRRTGALYRDRANPAY